MKIRRQDDFFKNDREFGPNRAVYGGEAASGKRKVRRPFKKNQPHHLIMKSAIAKGKLSLLGPKFKLKIARMIDKYSNRFKIKVHSYQNVGNHIHFLAGAARKEFLQNFLRTLAGLIARLVNGARKGKPASQKFWTEVVFSRVVQGRRDFKQMLNYLYKNYLEAEVGADARTEKEEAEAKCKSARTGRVSRCQSG